MYARDTTSYLGGTSCCCCNDAYGICIKLPPFGETADRGGGVKGAREESGEGTDRKSSEKATGESGFSSSGTGSRAESSDFVDRFSTSWAWSSSLSFLQKRRLPRFCLLSGSCVSLGMGSNGWDVGKT